MSRDPDCDVHVHLHPDEKCTCTSDSSQMHDYISTACYPHKLHDRCRRSCKFCSAPCGCPCGHPEAASDDPPPGPRCGFGGARPCGAYRDNTVHDWNGRDGLKPKTMTCHPFEAVGSESDPPRTETSELMGREALELAAACERWNTIALFRQVAPYLRAFAALKAELLRLNGPTCPYDGKRASEHSTIPQAKMSVDRDRCRFVYDARNGQICMQPDTSGHGLARPPHAFEPLSRQHPHVPEIEEWLRENAR